MNNRLTSKELDRIYKFVTNQGVEFHDLAIEMQDHIVSEIESA